MTTGANATAYFERVSETRFHSTPHVGGAWNTAEQHIAPAIGLLAHAIDVDHQRRRDDHLFLSRLSVDILGTLAIDDVDLHVEVVRPGRTIELVEARLAHAGRVACIARAWLTRTYDTGALAGNAFASLPPRDELTPWAMGDVWAGNFVRSLELRRSERTPGRAVTWARPTVDLVADETVSATARFLGLADVANGLAPRVHPTRAAFPNLDLTAHLFRAPESEWIGFDTTASFGSSGVGLTHSIVHDEHGAFGAITQTLTVRPMTAD